MDQLFGTDGIRGLAGEFPLDANTVRKVGASLARQYAETLGRAPRFITGRDTRESGSWIERAFHAGAASESAECESAGVITTPGVAFLTRSFEFDAGVVISASHNPYHDNGIKVFTPSGKKIDEMTERLIEADVFESPEPAGCVEDPEIDDSRSTELGDAYLSHLREAAGEFSAAGLRIVLDCANGASTGLASKLFTDLGAEVVSINCEPDGRNINENCGSTHIGSLREKVVEEKADLGVAFDGDADRALFVDEHGEIIDGDATLWIVAQYLKAHGKLTSSTVVATVMSNIGLELALRSKDINLLRTDVGDKYVLEKLLETRSEIGGEQSGHIIFPEISLVGDGMMTALLLLHAVNELGVSLSEATSGFVKYPQILKNVKVREKRPFSDLPEIVELSKQIESELHGQGRLLLRYSGTENLARVMIEGKDQTEIESQAKRLANVILVNIG
ncbi:MAG: phosphoglucosamine mutase [Pyrinomonadaceae bacterium]|nr:phosphoglucosamine mutase [Acidobacteriota bacterium]MBK7933896.1 phosphoglucosamine mutase [Acidobacteriota bacterium]MBP7377504.1 phosphoglucosamine mutase [Pyrinomonadaceae bacterium]